jgi:sulfite exporter TauE/SafE
MPAEVTFLSAFVVGLLGGVHCLGMCGGIVGALTLGLPESVRSDYRSMAPFLLAYNGGRISSYTIAGALMGGIGMLAANLAAVHRAQLMLQLLAGCFMVALGLYLGGWWLGLRRIEQVGGLLWKHIEPLGRHFLPVSQPRQAFALGLLWGWLPCGLVYSVLIWSIAAGGFVRGGLLMLSFGLGTLPVLLAMGASASGLAAFVRKRSTRMVAGAFVAAYGAYMLFLSLRAMF